MHTRFPAAMDLRRGRSRDRRAPRKSPRSKPHGACHTISALGASPDSPTSRATGQAHVHKVRDHKRTAAEHGDPTGEGKLKGSRVANRMNRSATLVGATTALGRKRAEGREPLRRAEAQAEGVGPGGSRRGQAHEQERDSDQGEHHHERPSVVYRSTPYQDQRHGDGDSGENPMRPGRHPDGTQGRRCDQNKRSSQAVHRAEQAGRCA